MKEDFLGKDLVVRMDCFEPSKNKGESYYGGWVACVTFGIIGGERVCQIGNLSITLS